MTGFRGLQRRAEEWLQKRAKGPSGDPRREQDQKERSRKYRAGTTLVEMIVTLLVFGIMMAMAVGILSPAAKTFLRMQRLQFARLILDNTIQELHSLTRDAVEYVKIYDTCGVGDDLEGKNGASEGRALEFLSTDDVVVLLSTQGCPDTNLHLGTDLTMDPIGQVAGSDIQTGRLLERYYVRSEADNTRYLYKYQAGGHVARAFTTAFADRYYMGNQLEIIFRYQPSEGGGGAASGDEVTYIQAEVRLRNDAGEIVAQDSTALDFRYKAVRRDDPTAITDPTTP